MTADIRIDVREPAGGQAGCVSARVGEFGPEICYAVGHEYGDWYVSLNEVLFAAAGVDYQPTHVAGGRRGAEQLVRLLAALYGRITEVDQ